MTAFLLSVHVLAAILAIGPVAIAASMFPAAVRAWGAPPGSTAVLGVLHRISRVYAVIGVIVPVFGIATAVSLGVLGNAWVIISMVLTAAAAAALICLVLPGQRRALAARATPDGQALQAPAPAASRLAMHAGIFNLHWAIVVVLMIVRPGSTTGAGL